MHTAPGALSVRPAETSVQYFRPRIHLDRLATDPSAPPSTDRAIRCGSSTTVRVLRPDGPPAGSMRDDETHAPLGIRLAHVLHHGSITAARPAPRSRPSASSRRRSRCGTSPATTAWRSPSNRPGRVGRSPEPDRGWTYPRQMTTGQTTDSGIDRPDADLLAAARAIQREVVAIRRRIHRGQKSGSRCR